MENFEETVKHFWRRALFYFSVTSYTILYEDNQGLVRLQELLKSPTQSDVKIVVRQLPQDEDYR